MFLEVNSSFLECHSKKVTNRKNYCRSMCGLWTLQLHTNRSLAWIHFVIQAKTQNWHVLGNFFYLLESILKSYVLELKFFCQSTRVLPLLPSQLAILPSCSLFETFPRKLEVVLVPVYKILIWSKDLGHLHYQARVGDVIVVSRVSIHQCDPENAMRDPQRLYNAIHHRDPGNGGSDMGIQKEILL